MLYTMPAQVGKQGTHFRVKIEDWKIQDSKPVSGFLSPIMGDVGALLTLLPIADFRLSVMRDVGSKTTYWGTLLPSLTSSGKAMRRDPRVTSRQTTNRD